MVSVFDNIDRITNDLGRVADALERITHLMEQESNHAGLTRVERVERVERLGSVVERPATPLRNR